MSFECHATRLEWYFVRNVRVKCASTECLVWIFIARDSSIMFPLRCETRRFPATRLKAWKCNAGMQRSDGLFPADWPVPPVSAI